MPYNVIKIKYKEFCISKYFKYKVMLIIHLLKYYQTVSPTIVKDLT